MREFLVYVDIGFINVNYYEKSKANTNYGMLKNKLKLVNYFDELLEEDIYGYIPSQRANQIFMSRWVVVKRVGELEANNLGGFDDPDETFAELYMKSELYITEEVVVGRL